MWHTYAMRDLVSPDPSLPFATTGPQGHRERMRTRLLSRGPKGLADYEMLEMLLFLSIPRRDTKPLAKSLINTFGDLYRSLKGTSAELRQAGLDPISIGVFDLVNEASRRLALPEAVSRPLLNDMPKLEDYLDMPTRKQRPPHVAVLLLNTRNQLLMEMPFEASDTPKAIAEAVAPSALKVHASALILVTIRPGAARPNERDRELTRRVAKMGQALSITLHDHFIFGKGGHESFKRQGLL